MWFVACVNVPGYLPEGDTPVFDTAAEAWTYLADEREHGEDDAYVPGEPDGYSDTLRVLRCRAKAAEADPVQYGPGTTYGATPGYDGDHDLGLAYTVAAVSEAEAAEIEALQD